MSDFIAWLSAQLSRPVDWPLVLQFVQALAWPTVTVGALIAIRPRRIIDALLDGGEVSAGPATLRFRRRIENITEKVEDAAAADAEAAVEEGPNDEPELVEPAPPVEEVDAYTTVMNGWALVTKGLDIATKLGDLPPLRKANPLDAVRDLRVAGLIDRRHVNAVEDLLDLRNSVRNAGSRNATRRGLSPDAAAEFYKNADTIRRSIITTTRRRLRKRNGDGDRRNPKSLN